MSTPSRQAWVALYDSGLGNVYGYLLHRCGDPVLAQDLTSETFLAVARAASGDHPVEPTMPWLMTIARHKLIDHWRHATIEEKSLQLIAGGSESTDERWTRGVGCRYQRRKLAHIDPTRNAVVATISMTDGQAFGDAVAFGGGYVWINAMPDALLAKIDPKTDTIVARYQEKSYERGLAADDEAVWVSSRADKKLYRLPLT